LKKNHHAFLIRRSDYRQELTPVSDENIPFLAGIGKIENKTSISLSRDFSKKACLKGDVFIFASFQLNIES
jgi:hypothetical protein